MSRLKLVLGLFLLVMMSLFVVLAAQGQESNSGLTTEEIVIGQWGPQTGSAAPYGAVARGTGVYFQMVTAQGGIHGRRIKLVMVDDHYDPHLTMAGVRKLVEEYGVFAFVGGVGTANGAVVMDYLTEQGVPWIGPASGSSRWSDPPRKSIFAVCPPYGLEAALLVKYAVETLGRTKIVFMYQDDEFGREGLAGAEQELSRRGLSLSAAIPLKINDDQLSPRVQELQQSKAEVVIMWLLPAQAALVRQLAAGLGVNPVWMTGSALSDTEFMYKVTSGRWAGTIFTNFAELPRASNPLLATYKAAYDTYALKGERWGPMFYVGFGLAEPLVEALRRCGPDLTREKLIKELEGLKEFQGIFGRISYGPEQRQGQRAFYLCQALKGNEVRVLSGWLTKEDL